MPIDEHSFGIAKDPSDKILEFLTNQPITAFALDEIFNGVEEFRELDIPLETIESSLESLVRIYAEVEMAFLKGEIYYKIKTNK